MRKIGFWLAVGFFGVLCLWWKLGTLPARPWEPVEPQLVRFAMGDGRIGALLYTDWQALGRDRRDTDSVQVRRGNGDTLFDGTWGALQVAAVDTIPLTAISPLPTGD